MANVIAQSGRPAIIMAHNKTLAAQLYAEMREFFPENAVEYFVSYYDYYQPEAYVPSRDLFIEKDSAINEHIEQMRLSATKNLMTRDDVIIVATVSAIYGIGDPTEYQQMVLSVKEGDTIEQRDIIATLVSMQYERGDLDFKRGSFRVRGDVIDVYPAESSENALRISLFDDEIDRLDMFDPLSGSLHQRVGRYTVFPSSHYVTPRDTVLRACESIKEELRERIEFFAREQRPVEQQRIEQRTRFDLEMLYEMGFCKGIENYSRHFSGKKEGEPPPTLMDYLPTTPSCSSTKATLPLPKSAACTKATHCASKTSWTTASACLPPATTARSNSTNLKKSCRKPSSFPPPPRNTKKNTPDKSSNKSSAPQGWSTPKSSSAPSPPKSTI